MIVCSRRFADRWYWWTSLFFLMMASIFTACIFAPGIMTNDSLGQYGEALRGTFGDWHPPVMSIVLHFFLFFKGGLTWLTGLQSISGILGIFVFSHEILRLLANEKNKDANLILAACTLTVLFLLPLTPTIFYFNTFIKDTWTAIVFLWVGAFSLRLFRQRQDMDKRSLQAGVFLLCLLMAFSSLPRHNSLIVLIPMGLCLSLIVSGTKKKQASLFFLLPLLTWLLINIAMYSLFSVRHYHHSNIVKALDLAGLCYINPDACRKLTYTRSSIDLDLLAKGYRFGNVHPLIWSEPPIATPGFTSAKPNPELDSEYLYALRNYPFDILRLKIESFMRLFDPRHTVNWFYFEIVPNPYGLRMNSRFSSLRNVLKSMLEKVGRSLPGRCLAAAHLPWLLVNVLGVFCFLFAFRQRQDRNSLFFVFLLLQPLSYYLSYLPATIYLDFRFMFPATLLMQVASGSFLCHVFLKAYGKKAGMKRSGLRPPLPGAVKPFP
ncbi:MAG TPA: hypothetical protein PLJ03_11140 [Syntrophales bacterium]|nr:hypothetical protein [Syntrophales bacterium]